MGGLTVAFSALLLSVVSLGIAIMDGRTMEKMADANARMVAANSWPFLSYGAGTATSNGVATINMHVANTGVGPPKSNRRSWFGRALRIAVIRTSSRPAAMSIPLRSSSIQTFCLTKCARWPKHRILGLTQPANPAAFAAAAAGNC